MHLLISFAPGFTVRRSSCPLKDDLSTCNGTAIMCSGKLFLLGNLTPATYKAKSVAVRIEHEEQAEEYDWNYKNMFVFQDD